VSFDPDAFLADQDEERPAFLDKPSGKGGGFNPDAFLAGGAAPAEPHTFRKADGTEVPNQTNAEMAAELLRERNAIGARKPSSAEAVERGAVQGASLGFGDEGAALVDTAISKIPGVRTVAEKINQTVGGSGAGLPLDRNLTYSERREAYRNANKAASDEHPLAYGAGEIGGSIATGFIPGAAPARGAGALRAAANAAKVGAVAGAGNSEADLTEGNVGGVLKDAATSAAVSGVIGGAASKLVRGSPERVDERLVANISRGPAGGAAKDKLYKKVVERAGDEFGDLNEVLARNPGAKASLVLNAANNPGKSAKIVTRVIDRVDGELSPMYRQIDAGPAPMSAVSLQNRLIDLQQQLKEAGNTGMADVVEKFEGHLAKHYGDGDAIKDGAKLTASALRRLKGEVGEIAFKGDAPGNTPFRTRAQQLIYGTINETIEDAASQTPGVSVERMRLLNKDSSTLIAVRDALADRGSKAAAGRTSLFQIMSASALTGGGFAAGGIEGAVGGALLAGGMKAAQPIARGIDYNLAKLVTAARNGSTPAQLGQMALELGVSRAMAEEISRRGLVALSEPPPNP
jgi:hypothetical protein